MFAKLLRPASRLGSARLPSAAAPDGKTLYVIGDVHGRGDLLEPLLAQIAEDASRLGQDEARELIFLGNLIDGGPDSRLVVDLVLMAEADHRFGQISVLRGTHEAAMARFQQDARAWPDWAVRGARATLHAYGVPAPAPFAEPGRWEAARRLLAASLPPDHADFFARLKPGLVRGDYRFVRSGSVGGASAALPGVVVHGDSRGEAGLGQRQICLDTDPHATGELGALRLRGEEQTWLGVSAQRQGRR